MSFFNFKTRCFFGYFLVVLGGLLLCATPVLSQANQASISLFFSIQRASLTPEDNVLATFEGGAQLIDLGSDPLFDSDTDVAGFNLFESVELNKYQIFHQRPSDAVNTSSELISNPEEAYDGTSLKVNLNFSNEVVSDSNWGTSLMLISFDSSDVLRSLDLGTSRATEERQIISFWAKTDSADTEIEISVALKEFITAADNNAEETYSTRRIKIKGDAWKKYYVGLNNTSFFNQDENPDGDTVFFSDTPTGALDVQAKLVFFHIYNTESIRGQNALFFIDDILLGRDGFSPRLGGNDPPKPNDNQVAIVPLEPLIKGDVSVMTLPLDLGGLDITEPTTTLSIGPGSGAVNVNSYFEDNALIITANIPVDFPDSVVHFTISDIQDVYGNSVDSLAGQIDVSTIVAPLTHNNILANFDIEVAANRPNELVFNNGAIAQGFAEFRARIASGGDPMTNQEKKDFGKVKDYSHYKFPYEAPEYNIELSHLKAPMLISDSEISSDEARSGNAIKIDVTDFGPEEISSLNYGVILSVNYVVPNSANWERRPIDLQVNPNNNMLTFYAKTDLPYEAQVIITEYDPEQTPHSETAFIDEKLFAHEETWSSVPITIQAGDGYQAYSVGLNSSVFVNLDRGDFTEDQGVITWRRRAVVDDEQFILTDGKVKSVGILIKTPPVVGGVPRQNMTVYIDDIGLSEDTTPPVLGALELGIDNAIPRGQFTITCNITDDGGFDFSRVPDAEIVFADPSVHPNIPLTVTTFDPAISGNDPGLANKIRLSGTIPPEYTMESATLQLSNVADRNGNAGNAESLQTAVDINPNYVRLHSLDTMTDLFQLNTDQSVVQLGLEDSSNTATLTMAYSAENTALNWGDGIGALLSDNIINNIALYPYFVYEIKSNSPINTKAYVIIEENEETITDASGQSQTVKEVWVQNDGYHIGHDQFYKAGVHLSPTATSTFHLDLTQGQRVNDTIDLDNIKSIQILFLRESGTTDTQVIKVKNIKLMMQDVLPPFRPEVPSSFNPFTNQATVSITPEVAGDVTGLLAEIVAPAVAAVTEGTLGVAMSNLQEGSNLLTLRAQDSSGNLSLPQTLDVVLDTTPPDPAVLSVPLTEITSPIFSLSGVATESYTVSLHINSQLVSSVFSDSQDAFTFDLNLTQATSLQGDNTVVFTSYDRAGNAGAEQVYSSVTFSNIGNLDFHDYGVSTVSWEKIAGYVSEGPTMQALEDGNIALQFSQDFDSLPQGVTLDQYWGALFWEELLPYQKNFTANGFVQLSFVINNSVSLPTLTTKVFLWEEAPTGETEKEVWISINDYQVTTTPEEITMVLSPALFSIDPDGPEHDGVIDFTKISHVGIGVYRGSSVGAHTVTIDQVRIGPDTTAPPAPTILTIDEYTRETAQTIEGAVSEDTVRISVTTRPDTIVHTETFDAENHRWTADISALQEGENNLSIVAFDSADNPSAETQVVITLDTIAPNAPILLADATYTTAAVRPDIEGTTDTDTHLVRLFVNDEYVGSTENRVIDQDIVINRLVATETTISITDTLMYFIHNVSLNTTENVVQAVSVDRAGNQSLRSAPVDLTVATTVLPLTFEGARATEELPIFIEIKGGAVTGDAIPQILELEETDLAYIVTPPNRVLVTEGYGIIDIILNTAITETIRISLPLPAGNSNPEIWYFDTAINQWTQEGISNVAVETRQVPDPVTGDLVTKEYVAFDVDHLSIFGIFTQPDNNSPVISPIKFDGKVIETGDYVRIQPDISTSFIENHVEDSGLATWNITVNEINKTDETETVVFSQSGNGQALINEEISVTVSVTERLVAGKQYKAYVRVSDQVDNVATRESKVFRVSDQLLIKDELNGPNPFNPTVEVTNIQYQLTKHADVTIYIFSISGEQLWRYNASSGSNGGSAGFNSVVWNGRNKYGEIVANGVYVAYIIANDGGVKVSRKVKIAVLK